MDIGNLGVYENYNSFQKKAEYALENKDNEELKKVCNEFEAIFLNMVFKEMKKTVLDSGFIEKDTGYNIFEDMYFEELSKEASNKEEGLGIAKMLYEQFTKGYIRL